MPRVEIINGATPSPTWDMCRDCAHGMFEGDLVPAELLHAVEQRLGKQDLPQDATVGSTDVAHPMYEYEVYTCNACGVVLTVEDA